MEMTGRSPSHGARWYAVILPMLAFAMLAVVAPRAVASHVNCGDTIRQDTNLDSDLTGCETSSALLIAADDVTLDLNNHDVTAGARRWTGINNLGAYDHLTVRNGRVTGFDHGVLLGTPEGTTGVTMGTVLTGLTTERITGYHTRATQITDGTFDRIYVSGFDDSIVERNRMVGIGVYGSSTTIRSNVVRGEGIYIYGSGNLVTRNQTSSGGISVGGDHSVASNNSVAGAGGGLSLSASGPGMEVRRNRVAVEGVGLELYGDEAGQVVDNDIRSQGDAVLFGIGAKNIELRRNRIKPGPQSVGITGLTPERVLIQGNTISGGRIGIELTDSLFVRAFGNQVTGNGSVGISMGQGYGAGIERNVVAGYEDGIRLEDGLRGSILTGNRVHHSRDDGIDLDAAGNTVTGNDTFANGDWGIEAIAGTMDGGGNRAWSNGQAAQCLNVVCAR